MAIENYDVLNMKTCVLKIQCACEGCKKKIKLLLQKIDGVYTVSIDAQGGRVEVTGNFDPDHLSKKLGKLATCSLIEAPKSSRSVMSAAPSARSRGESSKAGGSVKSGGEAQSQKASKAMSENKSVKSRVSGFGKMFGFGKSGGEKGSVGRSSRAGSKKSSASHHSGVKGSKADDLPVFPDREPSVGRSSRGGSKKGPASHHSGEKRSQIGDPYNHQDAARWTTSPPPPHKESYVQYFSDENPNACNIM